MKKRLMPPTETGLSKALRMSSFLMFSRTMTISVIELPDDREGGGSSKQEEEVDECNSKLVLSFTKAHTVYEIVKFYFYM